MSAAHAFHPLPDRHLPGLVERLSSGGPLGELLAERIRAGHWSLRVTLPADGVGLLPSHHLEQGGVASSAESLSALVPRVLEHLAGEERALAIFEDDCARRGDAWLARHDRPVHYVGDRVYHAARATDSPADVAHEIRKAQSARLLVGALTASDPLGRDLELATLRELAASATGIIADALDGEAYVLATPD